MRKNKFLKILVFSIAMVLSVNVSVMSLEDPPLQGGPGSKMQRR